MLLLCYLSAELYYCTTVLSCAICHLFQRLGFELELGLVAKLGIVQCCETVGKGCL